MTRPRFFVMIATALVAGWLIIGSFRSSSLFSPSSLFSSSSPASVSAASVKPDKDRKPAPEFTLKDADGKVVRLSDYKGKVVLLDFWATWCGPCKIEIPWFMELQRKNKDRGFEVIGIAMDDEGWEVVKPYAAKMAINYRLVMGNDPTARIYGGVDALPTTFLIDRSGRVAAVHVGLTSKKEFDNGVEQLLEDPAPSAADRVIEPALIGAK